MAIELSTPEVDRLDDVLRALRDWQDDAAPMQLHPGDLGWYARFGAAATAAAVRTWSRNGELVAIGFLDGADILRLTVAPTAWREAEVADQIVADASDPSRGVLPSGRVSVEAPDGTLVRDLLDEAGWTEGEGWTPLRLDLTEAVEDPGLHIEVVQVGHEAEFTAVHRSAWGGPGFTDDLWRTMAGGSAVAEGRCLLGRDGEGVAVAGVTMWPAGPGRPGLLEPVGVHADHRGRGYGRQICVAAAAELRRLRSSSVQVCTPSALAPAVATYESAGFRRLPERFDRTRSA